jgi:hypothetical protein
LLSRNPSCCAKAICSTSIRKRKSIRIASEQRRGITTRRVPCLPAGTCPPELLSVGGRVHGARMVATAPGLRLTAPRIARNFSALFLFAICPPVSASFSRHTNETLLSKISRVRPGTLSSLRE